MAYTWIKLYLALLDDPKLGRLPGEMFKQFIQFLLAARENDHDGLLEPVPDLAWRLRTPEDEILATLRALSEAGLMKETPDGWLVVNFAKEQAPVDGAERMRQLRERKNSRKNSLKGDVTERHDEYDEENEGPCDEAAEDPSSSASASDSDSVSEYRSVSDSVSESESAREISAETDPETVPDPGRDERTAADADPESLVGIDAARCGGDDPAGVVGHRLAGSDAQRVAGGQIQAIAAFEQNIGPVTPLIAESLRELEREYSPPWVVAAIREAVRANGLSLAYVDAILQRWKRDGFRSGKKPARKRHGVRGAEVTHMVEEFMNR